MSSYAELIAALKTFKNVKERRHAIKSLAAVCANTAYHNRIINHGGWKDAIKPLLTSLDQECITQATYALANLTSTVETHAHLIEHGAVTELGRLATEEDYGDLSVYAITALGNLAASPGSWAEMLRLGVLNTFVRNIQEQSSEVLVRISLFAIGNLTADLEHLESMARLKVLDAVWKYMYEPNEVIYMQTLSVIRGLATHATCRDQMANLGIISFATSCLKDVNQQLEAKEILLDILGNIASGSANISRTLLNNIDCIASLNEVLTDRKKYPEHSVILPAALAVIANVCEHVSLHDIFAGNKLMASLLLLSNSTVSTVQVHLVRAIANLSTSLKLHETILNGSRGLVKNLTTISVNESLDSEMCIQAAFSLSALTATKPTCISGFDQSRLLNAALVADNSRLQLLIVSSLANCATHLSALEVTLPSMKQILNLMYSGVDSRCYQELMRLLMNMSVVDISVAADLVSKYDLVGSIASDFTIHKLTIDGLIYACRLLTRAIEFDACRSILLKTSADGRSSFLRIMVTCKSFIDSQGVAISPHIALLAVTLTSYDDTKEALVRLGVVDFLVELYASTDSAENVRLRCIVGLANLVDYPDGCRAIVGGDGVHALLRALEVESHVDIILPALRAVLTLSKDEQHASLITGTEVGGVITIASFLYSDEPDVSRAALGILKNLLKISQENRLEFLGFTGCPDDFLGQLLRFLPEKKKPGLPPTIFAKERPVDVKADLEVAACVVSCLASLARERDIAVQELLLSVEAPRDILQVYDIATPSMLEDFRIFFSELFHSTTTVQKKVLSRDQTLIIRLVMSFEVADVESKVLSLSAILEISKSPELQPLLIPHMDTLVRDVSRVKDLRVSLFLARIFGSLAETGPKNLLTSLASLKLMKGMIELGRAGMSHTTAQLDLAATVLKCIADLQSRGDAFNLSFKEELIGVKESIPFMISCFLTYRDSIDLKNKEKVWRPALSILLGVIETAAEADYILRQLDYAGELCKVAYEAVTVELPQVQYLAYRLVELLSHYDCSRAALLNFPRLLEHVASFAKQYTLNFNRKVLERLDSGGASLVEFECYIISLGVLANLSSDMQSMFMTIGSRAPWNRRLLSSEAEDLSNVEEASIFVRYLPGKLMKRVDFELLAQGVKSPAHFGPASCMLEFCKVAIPCAQRYLAVQEFLASMPDCLTDDYTGIDELRLFLSALLVFAVNCYKSGDASTSICTSVVSLASLILYHCPDLCNRRINIQVFEMLKLSTRAQLPAITGLLAHASVKGVDAQVFTLPMNTDALQEAYRSDRKSRLNILTVIANVTRQSDSELFEKLGVSSWIEPSSGNVILQVDDYREIVEICKIFGYLNDSFKPSENSVLALCSAVIGLSLLSQTCSDVLNLVGRENVLDGVKFATTALYGLPDEFRNIVAAYPGLIESLTDLAVTEAEPKQSLRQVAFTLLSAISKSDSPAAGVIGDYLVNSCLNSGLHEDSNLTLRRLSITAAHQSKAVITESALHGVIKLGRAIQLHNPKDIDSQRRVLDFLIRSPVNHFKDVAPVFAYLCGLVEAVEVFELVVRACLHLVDCKEKYWAESRLLSRVLDNYPLCEPFPAVKQLLRLIYGLISRGYVDPLDVVNCHPAMLPVLRYSLSQDGDLRVASALVALWLEKQVDSSLWQSLADYGIVRIILKRLASDVDKLAQDYLLMILINAIDKGYMQSAILAADLVLVGRLFDSLCNGNVTLTVYRVLLHCGDCTEWLSRLADLVKSVEVHKQKLIIDLMLKKVQRKSCSLTCRQLVEIVESALKSNSDELKGQVNRLIRSVTIIDNPGRLVDRLVENHFVSKDTSFASALTFLSFCASKLVGDCLVKCSVDPKVILSQGNWGLQLMMNALGSSIQFKSLVTMSLPLPFDLSAEERAIAAMYCISHCVSCGSGVCHVLGKVTGLKYLAAPAFRGVLARLLRQCMANEEITKSSEYARAVNELVGSLTDLEAVDSIIDLLDVVSNSEVVDLQKLAMQRLLRKHYVEQPALLAKTAEFLSNAVRLNLVWEDWAGLPNFVAEALAVGPEVAATCAVVLTAWTEKSGKPLDMSIVKAITVAIEKYSSADSTCILLSVLSNDVINDASRSKQYQRIFTSQSIAGKDALALEVCRFGGICDDLKLCLSAFVEVHKLSSTSKASHSVNQASRLVCDCLIDHCRLMKDSISWSDFDFKSIDRAIEYCIVEDGHAISEKISRILYALCMSGFSFASTLLKGCLLKTVTASKDAVIVRKALPVFAVLAVRDTKYQLDDADASSVLLVISRHRWGTDSDCVLSLVLKMSSSKTLASLACADTHFREFISDHLQDPLNDASPLVFKIIHNLCMHVEDSAFFITAVTDAVEPSSIAGSLERRIVLGTIYGYLKTKDVASDSLKLFLLRFKALASEALLHLSCMSLANCDIQASYLLELILSNDANSLCTDASYPFAYVKQDKDNRSHLKSGRSLYQRNVWGAGTTDGSSKLAPAPGELLSAVLWTRSVQLLVNHKDSMALLTLDVACRLIARFIKQLDENIQLHAVGLGFQGIVQAYEQLLNFICSAGSSLLRSVPSTLCSELVKRVIRNQALNHVTYMFATLTASHRHAGVVTHVIEAIDDILDWPWVGFISRSLGEGSRNEVSFVKAVNKLSAYCMPSKSQCDIIIPGIWRVLEDTTFTSDVFNVALVLTSLRRFPASPSLIALEDLLARKTLIDVTRDGNVPEVLLVPIIQVAQRLVDSKDSLTTGLSLLLSICQNQGSCLAIAKSRVVASCVSKEALPLLSLLLSNDASTEAILKPTVISVLESVEVSVLSQVELHMLCFCLLSCQAVDRVDSTLRMRLEAMYSSGLEIATESANCKILQVDDLSLTNAIAENLRILFWSLLAGKGKPRDLSQQNANLIFQLFGSSEPAVLLTFVNGLLVNPRMHAQLVESHLILHKLADMSLPSPAIAELYVTTFCSFLGGPRESVIAGAKAAPGWLLRGIRQLTDFVALSDRTSSFARILHTYWLPRALPSLSSPLEHLALSDLDDNFNELLLLVMRRGRTLKVKLLALQQLMLCADVEYLIASGFSKITAKLLAIGDDPFIEGVAKSVTTCVEASNDRDSFRANLITSGFIPTLVSRARNQSRSSRTSLILWSCFVSILNACDTTVLDYLLRGNALEHFLYLAVDHGKGASLVTSFQTHALHLPVVENLRDAVYLAFQKSAVHGFLLVAGSTASAEFSALVLERVIEYVKFEISRDKQGALRKFLSATVLDLLPAVARDDKSTLLILNSLLRWSVRDRLADLLSQVCAAPNLVDFLVGQISSTNFQVAGAATCILMNAVHERDDIASLILREKRLIPIIAENKDFFMLSFVRAFVIFMLRKGDAEGWLPEVSSCMAVLTEMMTDMKEEPALAILAESALAESLKWKENRRVLMSNARCKELLLFQLEACLQYPHDEDAFESLLLPLMVLSDYSDTCIDFNALLRILTTTSRPLLRHYAGKFVSTIFFQATDEQISQVSFWVRKALSEGDYGEVLLVTAFLMKCLFVCMTPASILTLKSDVIEQTLRKRRRIAESLLTQEMLCLLFSASSRFEGASPIMDKTICSLVSVFVSRGKSGRGYNQLLYFDETPVELKARLITQGLSQEALDDLPWLSTDWLSEGSLFAPQIFSSLAVSVKRSLESDGVCFLCKLLVNELHNDRGIMFTQCLMRVFKPLDLWGCIKSSFLHVSQGGMLLALLLTDSRLPVNSESISQEFSETFRNYTFELISLISESQGENGPFFTLTCLADQLSMPAWCLLGVSLRNCGKEGPQVGSGFAALCYDAACKLSDDPEKLVHVIYAMFAVPPSRSFREFVILSALVRPPGKSFVAVSAALASLKIAVHAISKSNWVGQISKNQSLKDVLVTIIQFVVSKYTHQTVLVKHNGSVWDRLLLNSGLTLAMAKLLIDACRVDSNIPLVEQMGGARALREISAYCENFEARKEATAAMHKMLGLPELRQLSNK